MISLIVASRSDGANTSIVFTLMVGKEGTVFFVG